jgi:hypothetical protein
LQERVRLSLFQLLIFQPLLPLRVTLMVAPLGHHSHLILPPLKKLEGLKVLLAQLANSEWVVA